MQQLNRSISKFINSINRRAKPGQSLVETAIALPVLLLMMMGVFEVGWALRGYLTLVNMNREATRFAVRGVYLDFDSQAMKPNSTCAFDTAKDPFGVGYCKVISHATQSLASQLATDYGNSTGNASIIVTYYDIAPDPNFNCNGDADCFTGAGNNVPFDCTRFSNKNHPSGYISGENLASVEYPILSVKYDAALDSSPNKPAFYDTDFVITNTTALTKNAYHTGGPYFSRINPQAKVQELRGAVNQLNCQLTQKKLSTVGDNVIIVETSYNQEMLVGLPLITAFVPNPVPLYSHTAMRLTTDLRDTEEAEGCELYPMMIPYSALSGGSGISQGQEFGVTGSNFVDIPGGFGYLFWNPADQGDKDELMLNFNDPSRAATLFTDPTDSSDDILNIGDWIQADTGSYGISIKGPDPGMDDTLTRGKIIFPIWDDTGCVDTEPAGYNCPGAAEETGVNARYKIAGFVKLEVVEVRYTGSDKGVTFRFSQYSNNACACDPDTDGPACDPQ